MFGSVSNRTPGARSAKARKLRELCGRASIWRVVTLVPTEEFFTSLRVALPVITTFSSDFVPGAGATVPKAMLTSALSTDLHHHVVDLLVHAVAHHADLVGPRAQPDQDVAPIGLGFRACDRPGGHVDGNHFQTRRQRGTAGTDHTADGSRY